MARGISAENWDRATIRRDGLTPASAGIIQAIQGLGANLVGDLTEDDRTLLLRFALAVMEGPVRAGLLCWAAEVAAERAA